MIHLYTGLPGSGKTLSLIQVGLSLCAQGRKVYFLNIEGLDEAKTGFVKFPGSLSDWSEILKPGDVLLVDEVTAFFPRGCTRLSVPDWIERLTRNRHYGVDLYFATQDPKNIDTFIRRLVNEHQHFVNKWGAQESVVYKWPECVDDIDLRGHRKRADKFSFKYPAQIFDMYKSAELHTRKKYTPRRLKLAYCAFAFAAVSVVAAFFLVGRFSHKADARGTSAPHVAGDDLLNLSSVSSRIQGRGVVLTEAEYIKELVPLVDGMPWSAPIFSGLKPEARPEIYCISVEFGKCICHSEQGTHLYIKDALCRSIARDGIYNPFRRPIRSDDNFSRPSSDRPSLSSSSSSVSAPSSSSAFASDLRKPYDPTVFLSSARH